MKVLEKSPKGMFPREVRCSHCGSLLEIERQDCTLWFDSETLEDVCKFICPCCNEVNNPSPHAVLCHGHKFFSYMSFIHEDNIGSVAFRREHGEIKGIFTVNADILNLAVDVRRATKEEFEEYHRMKKALYEHMTQEEKEYLKQHGYL